MSLLQVDPLALVSLRETGRCTFRLPEELFDMDGPGHYLRRIKNVALTVPCVTGPFASINCTLTLQKSSIRTTPSAADDYARVSEEDSRSKEPVPATLAIFDRAAGQSSAQSDTLASNSALGSLLTGTLANIEVPAAVGPFTLFFADNPFDDLWLAVKWGKGG